LSIKGKSFEQGEAVVARHPPHDAWQQHRSTFPKKDEWPKVTAEEWVDDERSAFLCFKILNASIFAGLEFTVGTDSHTGY
jgi:hypothetical protein